eukprot:Seg168.2 transcript_id=Seg168.2/GoldUCD/mRNA.D3Y31 product="Serologically defined colon cancer antigen 8" protein_id=Seg168.2/GoldUCD/D3Y31
MMTTVAGSHSSLRGYQRQLRDQAESSIDDLREKLTISPAKSPDRRGISKTSPSAYSASVKRLKNLLKRHDDLKQKKDYDESLSIPLDIPPAGELAPLLDDQHTLLQHLEGQVSYYKDSLSMLKQKAEIVIEENTRLHEQLMGDIEDRLANDVGDQRSVTEMLSAQNLVENETQTKQESINNSPERKVTDTSIKKHLQDGMHLNEKISSRRNLAEIGTQTEKESTDAQKTSPERKVVDTSIREYVQDRMHLHETENVKDENAEKINDLERTVFDLREELKGKQKQLKNLESQLWIRDQDSLHGKDKEDGLCIKCAHNEAIIGPLRSRNNEVVMKRIESENKELLDTVSKQRKMLEDFRTKEIEAYIQVKKSCELAEQAQLEKHEAAVNLQQANKEIDRLKEENKKQAIKTNQSVAAERAKLQYEWEEKLRLLNKEIDELSETVTRKDIQLERCTREKMDVKSTLAKIETETSAHDAEIDKALEETRKALCEANAERNFLKQENSRLEKEKRNLEAIQEQKFTWSNSEQSALKKRLTETERRLETCKSNCVSLNEELQIAQKELQLEKGARSHEGKIHHDQMFQLQLTKKQQEEKLERVLRETEGKYETTKMELTSLLESQIQIANGFKEECKRLRQQYEEVEKNHRETLQKMTNDSDNLRKEAMVLLTENKSLKEKNSNQCAELQRLENALANSEIHGKTYAEKAITLMNKYNAVLRERQALREEIDFLKSQLPGFRKSDRISISDLESTDKPM